VPVATSVSRFGQLGRGLEERRRLTKEQVAGGKPCDGCYRAGEFVTRWANHRDVAAAIRRSFPAPTPCLMATRAPTLGNNQ